MKPTRAKFWMVWCPTGHAPTKQHHSREAADTEAARLAEMNPGKEFIVLKAVGGAAAKPTEVRPIKIIGAIPDPDFRDIPF